VLTVAGIDGQIEMTKSFEGRPVGGMEMVASGRRVLIAVGAPAPDSTELPEQIQLIELKVSP
jgi:hypothetical protein